MSALTLDKIPGFADIPAIALYAGNLALGSHLAKISDNAALGMIRLEKFKGLYKNGDTIPLPVSAVDGYTYTREELIYIWGVQTSFNPSTGWITGPDALWYAGWKVQQWNDTLGADNSQAGLVSTEEWYRKSTGDDDGAQSSNDGVLEVLVIGQRQRTNLTVVKEITAYTDIDPATLVTDAAYTQGIAQGLDNNAKFSVLKSEILYLGEFVNGDTIPLANLKSPADSHAYAYADCKFMFSWRWTTLNSAYTQPDKSLGQLGPQKASIDGSTGAVTVSVEYINDTDTTETTHGRIAAFAFCSRSSLIDSIPATANSFAEIDQSVFFPGETERASVLVQLNKNIREAAISCECSTPTDYAQGDTVPTLVSPIDGYTYSRDEIDYQWEWSDTSNQTGTNLRQSAFWAEVEPLGNVILKTWRLPPGGGREITQIYSKIRVTVIGIRGSVHTTTSVSDPNEPGDSSTQVVDNVGATKAPYLISIDTGDTTLAFAASQTVSHIIGGGSELTGVLFPSALPGAYFRCRHAPTGNITVTIKKGATTLGTVAFSSGSTTGSATWSSAQNVVPGDQIDHIMPATPDATFAGYIATMVGKRS